MSESEVTLRPARMSDAPDIARIYNHYVGGFGALGSWGSRRAYHRTVEISTWVGDGLRGRGIGRPLATGLLGRAGDFGHHAIIAQVVAGNEARLTLYDRLGFERVGVLREVGDKFGLTLDVVLLELVLSDVV